MVSKTYLQSKIIYFLEFAPHIPMYIKSRVSIIQDTVISEKSILSYILPINLVECFSNTDI